MMAGIEKSFWTVGDLVEAASWSEAITFRIASGDS